MPLHTFRSRKLPSTCTDVYLRLPLLVHQCILCILAARAVVPSVNLPRHYCLYCKSCCNFVKISTLLVCPLARREALSSACPDPRLRIGVWGDCVWGIAADLLAVSAITTIPAGPPSPHLGALYSPIVGVSALVMVSGGEGQANWWIAGLVDLDLPARRRL